VKNTSSEDRTFFYIGYSSKELPLKESAVDT